MPKSAAAKEPVYEECLEMMRPIRDALDVVSGKWKLRIIASLTVENKRFRQMAKEIVGITDKMLSKELKDLETNQLIKRSVYDTFPPTVEYSITEHGRSLRPVIFALRDWGNEHRKQVIGK